MNDFCKYEIKLRKPYIEFFTYLVIIGIFLYIPYFLIACGLFGDVSWGFCIFADVLIMIMGIGIIANTGFFQSFGSDNKYLYTQPDAVVLRGIRVRYPDQIKVKGNQVKIVYVSRSGGGSDLTPSNPTTHYYRFSIEFVNEQDRNSFLAWCDRNKWSYLNQ